MSQAGPATHRSRLIGLPTDALSSFPRGVDVLAPHPSREVNAITATLAAKLVRELASLVPGARP